MSRPRGRPKLYNIINENEPHIDKLEYQRRLQALYRQQKPDHLKEIYLKCYDKHKSKRIAESKAYYHKLRESYLQHTLKV